MHCIFSQHLQYEMFGMFCFSFLFSAIINRNKQTNKTTATTTKNPVLCSPAQMSLILNYFSCFVFPSKYFFFFSVMSLRQCENCLYYIALCPLNLILSNREELLFDLLRHHYKNFSVFMTKRIKTKITFHNNDGMITSLCPCARYYKKYLVNTSFSSYSSLVLCIKNELGNTTGRLVSVGVEL